MPKFSVIVTRDCTESTTVEVEALSQEDAIQQALDQTQEHQDFDWVHDECSGSQGERYVTGCEEDDA